MYYRNNVTNTQTLLDAMVKHSVLNFIFSSTAATFGEPEYTPIDEKHSQKPINPYGHSKLMVEQILADFDHAYGLKSVSLRYFNAAGADPDGELGERMSLKHIWFHWCYRQHQADVKILRYLVVLMICQTAPVFVITSILMIYVAHICWRWNIWLMVVKLKPTTWVMGRAIRLKK